LPVAFRLYLGPEDKAGQQEKSNGPCCDNANDYTSPAAVNTAGNFKYQQLQAKQHYSIDQEHDPVADIAHPSEIIIAFVDVKEKMGNHQGVKEQDSSAIGFGLGGGECFYHEMSLLLNDLRVPLIVIKAFFLTRCRKMPSYPEQKALFKRTSSNFAADC
jgi:hypothetical protein